MPHTYAGFFSLPCCVLHRIALAVVSEWCQKFVDYTSLIPVRSASESERGGPARNRSRSRSTTLCDEQWYLGALLGRNLHDPPHLWLVLESERPRLLVYRFTHLLEEARVQAPGRLGNQYPVHPLTYVFVSVQGWTLWGRTGERRRKLATRAGAIGRISRPVQ
jgi:hypothetical protein